MLPFYMLKGIPDPEFTLMEKNMSLNLSLVKGSLCGPMHRRFCSNPPVAFDKISVPKKACTMGLQGPGLRPMRDEQLNGPTGPGVTLGCDPMRLKG